MKLCTIFTLIIFTSNTYSLFSQNTSTIILDPEPTEKGFAKLKVGSVVPLGELTDLEFRPGIRVEIGGDIYVDFLSGAYLTGDIFYSSMSINKSKLINNFNNENKTLQSNDISNQVIFGGSFGVGYDFQISKRIAISPQINYSTFMMDAGGVSKSVQNDINGNPLYIETYDDFFSVGIGLRPGITAKWFFSQHVGVGVTADVDFYLYFDNRFKEVTYIDPLNGPRYPDTSIGFSIDQNMTTNILGVLYIKIPDDLF